MEIENNFFNEYSNSSLEDFDNLTPLEMHNLLYEDKSIVKINEKNEDLTDIPFINQIKYLLKRIDEEDGIKLTQAGYIPPKIVKDLYNQKYIVDEDIEAGITKLTKEIDSNTVILTRIICEISGFLRKRYNHLYITKKAKTLQNAPDLLEYIINIFGNKFNLSYFDGFIDNGIGNIGYKYTLYLLSKYGKEEREIDFYGEKYFTAFPNLVIREPEYTIRCYSIRTFERFLKYFNLIELKGKKYFEPRTVRKTALFDKYISVKFK